jgi:hypothetical protein
MLIDVAIPGDRNVIQKEAVPAEVWGSSCKKRRMSENKFPYLIATK